MPRLTLLSRPDCGLCAEFLAEFEQLAQQMPLPDISVLDVDSDPELARRYGLEIPVLLLDGIPVCRHRLDRAELARLLRPR